jgi:DNA-binding NarL/FixJ family response regulator
MACAARAPLESQSEISSRAVITRILIADDNEVVRSAIHTLIDVKTGFRVCGEAEDGIDAVQKAKNLLPDVVLLDLRMPRINGLEAASIIKRTLPSVRIVLFTMFAGDISETVRTAANIDLVLRKPAGLDSLVESIQGLTQPN